MKIKINKKNYFNLKKAPLIIAEISGNHCGNKKLFLKHKNKFTVETSCVFLCVIVFVVKLSKLKFDFENLKLVILPLTTLIVSPLYNSKIFLFPKFLKFPFLAYVV